MRLIDADSIEIPHFHLATDRIKVVDAIDNAPTIEPKRGEWIRQEAQHKVDKTVLDCRVCSECGAAYVIHNNIKDLDTDPPNFCPNCGADMRERSE